VATQIVRDLDENVPRAHGATIGPT
jgi:hypothetical protein